MYIIAIREEEGRRACPVVTWQVAGEKLISVKNNPNNSYDIMDLV